MKKLDTGEKKVNAGGFFIAIVFIFILDIFFAGVGIAMIDTHVFKLNEYFVELNPANFKVLNRILN